MTLLCLCLALSASGASSSLSGPDVQWESLAGAVERTLESDPDLLRHHRGYRAFLERNPRIAAAEEAYAELDTLTGFRTAVGDIEEALVADPLFKAAFDDFYGVLDRDPVVRQAVDGIYRYGFREGDRVGALQRALDYLRAHPDEALEFLENPAQLVPVPEELEPTLLHWRKDEAGRAELLGRFRTVHENPLAHLKVFPWWKALAEENGDVAKVHRRLMAYFAGHEHQFWVWHRRNLVLASQDHARDWITYWHRRVRRRPDLAPSYGRYLALLNERAELGSTPAARWDADHEPATAWPPEGPPPELPRLPKRERSRPTVPTVLVPRPVRPTPPTVPLPEMPQRPSKPEPPAEPETGSE